MDKIEIAAAYIEAMKHQYQCEQAIDEAFRMFDSDNQLFSTASRQLKDSYASLVREIVGEEALGWIDWWMYETEFGKERLEFSIMGVLYDPTSLSAHRFLQLVMEMDEQ